LVNFGYAADQINNFMLSFLQFICERHSKELVHRMDTQPIETFNKGMKTYNHNPNWGQSGQRQHKPAKGWGSRKGLFAADLHNVAAYAAPRHASFVQHRDASGQSHITFNKKDRDSISQHRPTLSSFDARKFKTLPSGESFSQNPGKPMRQVQINPHRFMQQHGHKVHFVDSLEQHRKTLSAANTPHQVEQSPSWE
jgi:hypothetical protein